jgi:ribosome-binding factor A
MTADLKNAKIYVSIFNQVGSKEDIINKLNFHKKQIRFMLGKRVILKFLPDLIFFDDETQEQVEKFEKIFQQIHKYDNK